MNMIFDFCKKCDCNTKRPIVNKTYYLCKEKNHERLHNGESIIETAIKKKVELIKKTKKTKRKTIKTRQQIESSKLKLKYIQVCKEIDNEREPICTGCGRHQGRDIKLSHSHIISRQQCRNIGREDLIVDKRNITFHCLDFGEHEGCHRKWENPKQRKQLLDYSKNVKFIELIDKQTINV